MDLEALATDELRDETAGYQLEWFDVEASSRRSACAHPKARRRSDHSPATARSTRPSTRSTQPPGSMRGYGSSGSTRSPAGQDALGETSVVLEVDGATGSGKGVSTDILDAAGRAHVRALSNALRRQRVHADAEAAAIPTPRTAAATGVAAERRGARLARRTPSGRLPACLRG
jgi:2-isopropylmalate synthase